MRIDEFTKENILEEPLKEPLTVIINGKTIDISHLAGATDRDKANTFDKMMGNHYNNPGINKAPSHTFQRGKKLIGMVDVTGNPYKEEVTLEDTQDFHEEYGYLGYSVDDNDMFEAKYQGRTVKLNKPMRGDVKKFKVYVNNEKGNVIKVNFGHGGTSAKRPTMRIRKSNPKARKS
jgi:hypothetical protein